jgi:hypothetical protein
MALAGLLGLVASATVAQQRPVTLKLETPAAAALDSLDVTPLRVLDYGSFRWVELSPADAAVMKAAGVRSQVVADAGQVRVMDYRFDPLFDGEPDIAPALRAPYEGNQLRLVQFHGPNAFDWLQRLDAAGARVLQYYPHNTYLVWSGADVADAVAGLPFVRWEGLLHPAYKVTAELAQQHGRIENVDVMFYNDGDVQATLDALRQLGGDVLNHYPAQPDRAFFNAIVRLDDTALEAVARLPQVVAIGYQGPRPILDDEASDQILAGNYTGTPPLPVTGYNSFLTGLGYDGTGVIWSITDAGVDYDHGDLNTRIVGGQNYPGCTTANPGDATSDGHGTHVAGIVGADATAGFTDGNGFLYGLGVAPNYSIFAQNPICPTLSSWPPAGGWQVLSKNGVAGSAVGANNSWTTSEGTQHGYQASERTHDLMVRDGDFDTASVAEPYILVFSAGNSGFSGLTSPKEAKNLIATASSRNSRAGSIDAISSFSSRGPAIDGRIVPTIAAPGETISSTRADGGGSCTSPIANTNNQYAFCSGTSMASPHASGAVVLITEWWRDTQGVGDPSAAFAKAMLVNGAVDMGTADIPNNAEGWGRIDLANMLQPTVARAYVDQTVILNTTGDSVQYTFLVDNPAEPVKVTLAWSDAPGAVGANPALVNDLDLTVRVAATDTLGGGVTYWGNDFAAGMSTTGGSADTLNNLENVFTTSAGGTITVTITASNIAGDGVPYNADLTDQDFALVCHNCAPLDEIFGDGFESGNTSAWSAVVP